MMMNDLLSATASKSPYVLLSLDISSTFDTLHHQRLLEWAKNLFGFDSTVLQWLVSYIVGREQFVGVASCHSLTVMLFSGVPQGSVLSLLLFSIFMTTVGNLISTFGKRYNQFTDDMLSSILRHQPDWRQKGGLWRLWRTISFVCNGTSTFITLAARQAARRLQSSEDDLQGPATPAITVSLRTCRRLQTAADTAVVREVPAGRAQNQDIDRVTCIQLSGTTCLEQPDTTRTLRDIY